MTGSRSANEARKGVARLAAMASPRLFLLSVALGALAAVVLASCGGDDDDGTLPPENASATQSPAWWSRSNPKTWSSNHDG